ncbi:hypothetical protein BDZ97DRAFT_1759541 [Flammula alnicola]|nr:hypothetical protein BDZ97DRAFT_1759541 [Flammula alnicola]
MSTLTHNPAALTQPIELDMRWVEGIGGARGFLQAIPTTLQHGIRTSTVLVMSLSAELEVYSNWEVLPPKARLLEIIQGACSESSKVTVMICALAVSLQGYDLNTPRTSSIIDAIAASRLTAARCYHCPRSYYHLVRCAPPLIIFEEQRTVWRSATLHGREFKSCEDSALSKLTRTNQHYTLTLLDNGQVDKEEDYTVHLSSMCSGLLQIRSGGILHRSATVGG